MADKVLVCKDCAHDFSFTEGEQKFYTEKGFPEPIRCPVCRKAKKDKNKNQNP
jgi:rubrerythrin